MRRLQLLSVWSIITSFALGFYLYPAMPDTMASHWDTAGMPNGYVSKFWGLFLIPILSTCLYAVFVYTPLGPHRTKESSFRRYYEFFFDVLILFFFYLYVVTVIWNTGIRIPIGQALAPAIGVLYYVIGDVLPHSKRNRLFGIRTPWTLADDRVWEATHKKGASLFRVCGLLAVLGMITPRLLILLVIPILISTAYLFWYSWSAYRTLHRK